MHRSRISSTLLPLAFALSFVILSPSPGRAGGGDEPHAVRWVQGSPVQFLGGSYLGIQAIDITPELRHHFGVPNDAGLLVGKVIEGSPAEAAGLKVGDVVTAVEGKAVSTHGELVGELGRHEEGDAVVVEAWRGGHRLELSAKLEKQTLSRLPALGKGVHFLPKWQIEGLDPEAFSQLGETVSNYFSSPEWRQSLEALEDHRGGLLERLQELEKRLREMEGRLEAMGEK